MIAIRLIIFPLALALSSCKPSAPQIDSGPQPATASPASVAVVADTCPDRDFATFLQRFADSADVQKTSTADPLQMDSIDSEAVPEPAPISKQVPRAEVTFPLMYDAAQQKTEGLQSETSIAENGDQSVVVRQPDTDIQTTYYFHRSPCWTLYRLSDDTL